MTTEQLGKITLVHGDCMDYMRTLPDNAFDLAIIDPPYGDAGIETEDSRGLRFHGGDRWSQYDRFNGSCFKRYRRKKGEAESEEETESAAPAKTAPAKLHMQGGTWAAKYRKESNPETLHLSGGRSSRYYKEQPESEDGEPRKFSVAQWDTAPDEEYFEELFRVSRNQIIWGANYFPNMPPTRCFVVWRKLTISEKFSMAMAEYAWTSFNQNAKVFECAPQGTARFPRFHPTQKPVELYAWLLANFAKEGDKIFDTHGGSMSHAIAAHNLGFELTIIEKDDEYYAKARERLIKHQRQLTLF